MRGAVLILLLSMSALRTADAACAPDYRWTEQEGEQNPEHKPCAYCRNLDEHPEDFRNAFFNFVIHEAGLSSVIPMLGLGDVFSTGETFCNAYGQCATGTLVIQFEPALNIGGGVSIPVHTGISSATFSVFGSDGETVAATYYEGQLSQSLSPLSVGAGQPVATPVSECLDNRGMPVERSGHTPVPPIPDADVPPTWPQPPGGGGDVPAGGGGGARACGWYAIGNEVVVVCAIGV